MAWLDVHKNRVTWLVTWLASDLTWLASRLGRKPTTTLVIIDELIGRIFHFLFRKYKLEIPWSGGSFLLQHNMHRGANHGEEEKNCAKNVSYRRSERRRKKSAQFSQGLAPSESPKFWGFGFLASRGGFIFLEAVGTEVILKSSIWCVNVTKTLITFHLTNMHKIGIKLGNKIKNQIMALLTSLHFFLTVETHCAMAH